MFKVLGRLKTCEFEHDHVYMVTPEGHKRYLTIKNDVNGKPYFVEVRGWNYEKKG